MCHACSKPLLLLLLLLLILILPPPTEQCRLRLKPQILSRSLKIFEIKVENYKFITLFITCWLTSARARLCKVDFQERPSSLDAISSLSWEEGWKKATNQHKQTWIQINTINEALIKAVFLFFLSIFLDTNTETWNGTNTNKIEGKARGKERMRKLCLVGSVSLSQMLNGANEVGSPFALKLPLSLYLSVIVVVAVVSTATKRITQTWTTTTTSISTTEEGERETDRQSEIERERETRDRIREIEKLANGTHSVVVAFLGGLNRKEINDKWSKFVFVVQSFFYL